MATNACPKNIKIPKLPPITKDRTKKKHAKNPYLQKGFLKLDFDKPIFSSLVVSSCQADFRQDGITLKKNAKKLSLYLAVTASLDVPTYL